MFLLILMYHSDTWWYIGLMLLVPYTANMGEMLHVLKMN